jgi:hypothetical protein
MFKKWKYKSAHIPGIVDGCKYHNQLYWEGNSETQTEMTELEFLRQLNIWNTEGRGHWQYWSMEH